MKKFFLLAAALSLFGCMHNLEVCNLYEYQQGGGFDFSKKGLYVDIDCADTSEQSQKFCECLREQLVQKGGFAVSGGNMRNADIGIMLNMDVDESANGSNFFVSWPGFLIFTHAWLGYGYDVFYNVRCQIVSAKTGKELTQLEVPIRLHLRYADFGTTWAAGCGWLIGWTVTAAANGLYVMAVYDDDITPELYYKAYPDMAGYVASKVAAEICALKDIEILEKPQAVAMKPQMSAPFYEIVYCRRNAKQEFSYEFELVVKNSHDNPLGAFRTIQREFRNAVREDYINAFPGTDASSLRIDFPQYEQKDGRITGRAVVLAIAVASLNYDPNKRTGKLAVKVNANQYEEARKWIRKNIETLARDKNIALTTGEIPPAAKFYLGREELKDGNVLEIEFKTE